MSHTLFKTAPLLRCAPRHIPRPQSFHAASYSTTNTPKMPTGTHQLRTIIRQTTLRASTTALQRATPYPAHQFYTQNIHHQQHHQLHTRSRSPSPPPPYQTRNTTLRAPQEWTHFTTPYTLSSVRTFTSSARAAWPSSTSPSSPQLSPETQARVDTVIEQIADLYGTAKDEFDIASEETAKNSLYASDDRDAAREELDTLLEYYGSVVGDGDEVAEEVRRRVGQRIRELEAGVKAMEEEVMHGD